MDKMTFKTKDIANENVQKIASMFPSVMTEGKVDFEKLRQELSNEVIDKEDECYDFTWVGKKAAMVEANKPTTKTLRPCREESVNFDTTENLYIEGDNLEVLKLLQESYLGKIKMIYIDPPYNTGNDFIYNDDFKMEADEYKDVIGEMDENGNRMFKNSETNGRYHSDWCSMIYSRLKLAHNLLSDDGVIFISIDDNEVDNLRKICDEVFGESNFVANFIRKTGSVRAMAINFDIRHDYVLIYSKKIIDLKLNEVDKDVSEYQNLDNDPKGVWSTQDYTVRSGGFEYSIPSINGKQSFKRKYMKSIEDTKILMGGSIEDGFKEIYKKAKYIKDKNWYILGEFVFKGDENIISRKKYASETGSLRNHTLYDNIGSNRQGSTIVKQMFNSSNEYFSMPKPVELLYYLEFIGLNKNDIILDFFSGSATTAHAVMKLNAEDGGNRKFIMVQLPEETDKDKEAYKAGYKNICEIGKERTRRAGKKILEENKDKENIKNLDIGFRVLKLDDSNMKDVYFNPEEYTQDLLSKMTSNIKEDRTEDDLLFASLIERGVPLNKSYRKLKINKHNVIIYNEEGEVPEFIACFDENISEKACEDIAKMKPLKAVFRDSSFGKSSDKINVEEIFKMYSPDTKIKVF